MKNTSILREEQQGDWTITLKVQSVSLSKTQKKKKDYLLLQLLERRGVEGRGCNQID